MKVQVSVVLLLLLSCGLDDFTPSEQIAVQKVRESAWADSEKTGVVLDRMGATVFAQEETTERPMYGTHISSSGRMGQSVYYVSDSTGFVNVTASLGKVGDHRSVAIMWKFCTQTGVLEGPLFCEWPKWYKRVWMTPEDGKRLVESHGWGR